jgi:ethanolamine utilization protein EutN
VIALSSVTCHLSPENMLLARIVGTVVATRKDERLHGRKLLIARLVDEQGQDQKGHVIAIDTVGAGFGEVVLIVQGSSARMAEGLKDAPVDAAVVGIVDSVDVR